MARIALLCCLVAAVAASPPASKSRVEIEQFKAALEKSRQDDGLTLEERMQANPQANAWENSGKFEGDMLLDEHLVEALTDAFATGRNAFIQANTKWPSNVAVYEFGAGEFNVDQQRYILYIMSVLEERSCVRFRLRNASDRNYVRLTGQSNGCYASVGYNSNRGIHTLNLARANPGQGCMNGVIIAHEWLHVLGFFHMQSTYTRDNYVRIHWENIINGMAHNFEKYDNRIVSNLGVPYEYGSCMHYGTHGFSSNGRPTISTLFPYNGVLGQTTHITGWDFLRLGRHYNCPGAWSAEATEKARTTFYVAEEDGQFVERTVDSPELI